MTDPQPIAYTALTKGTRVLAESGAEIGTVEHVLQDEPLDLFDGLAVKTHHGLRFVGSPHVTTITTDAVHTSLTDDQVASLPAPDGDPVFEADPLEYQGKGLTAWYGRLFLREHWMRDRD